MCIYIHTIIYIYIYDVLLDDLSKKNIKLYQNQSLLSSPSHQCQLWGSKLTGLRIGETNLQRPRNFMETRSRNRVWKAWTSLNLHISFQLWDCFIDLEASVTLINLSVDGCIMVYPILSNINLPLHIIQLSAWTTSRPQIQYSKTSADFESGSGRSRSQDCCLPPQQKGSLVSETIGTRTKITNFGWFAASAFQEPTPPQKMETLVWSADWPPFPSADWPPWRLSPWSLHLQKGSSSPVEDFFGISLKAPPVATQKCAFFFPSSI